MLLLSQDITLKDILFKYPDFSGDIDADKMSEEALNWLNDEIKFAGKISNVLQMLDPDVYEKIVKSFSSEFDKIINSDAFKNVPLPEGGTVSFSASEIKFMKERSKEVFAQTDDYLARAFTILLSKNQFKPIDEIEAVEPAVANFAAFVLLSGDENNFRFSFDTRKKAIQLLTAGGPFPDWMWSYIPQVADKLRAKLEAKFGTTLDKLDPSKFPREERQGILDELSLYMAIAGK